MPSRDKYVFLPSFSLDPAKLVSYNSVFLRDYDNETLKPVQGGARTIRHQKTEIRDKNAIKRDFHNFKISDNAYRTLKRRINWLYYMAKSKKVKTYSGKDIFNFKIGFITLTLPSKQRTCTKELTENCLNQFLTEVRQRTGMQNYVWRLEFQKNGNAHYHIVTDTYLDYFLIRKIWNRILDKNGYIEPYRQKFQDLSLSAYNKMTNKNGKRHYKDVVKSYAAGKRENWSNPNSVDVKSVISNQAIANYISKYFAKDAKHETICNQLDDENNAKSLRLWFCSRSLSKLSTVSDFCDAVEYDIFAIVSFCSDVKKVIGKYATSYYFQLKNFSHNARSWIERILRKYALDNGYVPASG